MQPLPTPVPPHAREAADPEAANSDAANSGMTAPPAALLPPSDLDALRAALAGRYAIERPLGAGGMATVWLGRDEPLDRPVAVKVIARELTASAVLRERFLQEARTVARLRHPHVVQVYAAGEAAGLLWFAMEYVPGGSLRDRLQAGGPLPAAEAAAVLRDLADALATAHRAGVVHRDVKPENVLVEAEGGRVRLGDFGVARALEVETAGDGGRLTRAGMVMGSPRYMSPEQAASDPTLDGRSDVYALGLVGYELLAGVPAFDGPSGTTLLVKQLTQAPAPLATLAPDTPPALVAVIERAIEKDPAARWQDAADMRDALDAVLDDLGHRTGGLAGATPGDGARRGLARTSAGGAGPPAAGVGGVAAGDRPAPVGARRPGWRRAAPVAAALVLLGVGGYAAARRVGGPPAGVDPRRSFAVAPFDVLSPDPQLRWLREGSVNMLTLDLAQWRDVRVADYERTLDALRDLHLDGAARIGRDDARALARRLDAWTVVTGRVQGTGDSLFVVASLYDVATGRKLDEAQRGAPRTADPRPLYDLVARDLLDLAGAPPITVDLTRTTTASLAAYRAYLDGVRALNSWRLGAADSLFASAVREDSTFALAWYKRALGRGWSNLTDGSQLAYAERAMAHADRLTPAQRALLAAYVPLARGFSADAVRGGPAAMAAHFDSARVGFARVVGADSTSVEGWYGLGDAWYHRADAEAGVLSRTLAAVRDSARDPARAAERQEAITQTYAARLAHGYAQSRHAFERTIALDSSYHLAYSHLVGIYQLLAAGVMPLVLDGDSLRAVAGPSGVRAYGGQTRVDSARARARTLATTAARGWAGADPDSPQAQLGLVQAFLAVGRPDSAAAAAERALARPTLDSPMLAYAAVYAQFAADPTAVRPALARALARFPAESLRGRQEGPNTFGAYALAASVAAGVGRLDDARAVLAAGAAAVPALQAPGAEKQQTQPLLQWYATALEVAAGLPAGPRAARLANGLRIAEERALRGAGPTFTPAVLSGLVPIAYTGFLATGDTAFMGAARRLTRATGVTSFPELDALAALRRGDTATAAAAIRAFPAPAPPTTLGLSGLRATARAEALTRSGDLRGALAWYEYLDPQRFSGVGHFETGIAGYAGSLLARAALHERLGEPARAADAYTRFLALRRDADPAFAPQVAAARAALARVRDARTTTVPVTR